MTRIAVVVFFGLLVGCATDSSVKKQMQPLEDKITALEKAEAAQNQKLDAQTAELASMKKGMQDQSAASAARAQEAAKEAAAAAARAEEAAQKSTKAFELSQVKGAKK